MYLIEFINVKNQGFWHSTVEGERTIDKYITVINRVFFILILLKTFYSFCVYIKLN